MSRVPLGPAAVVGLGLAILAVVGCQSKAPTGGTPTTASTAGKATPTSAPAAAATKLFADWPKPAGALVITGEQVGYLTPCGCTQGQKGGLIRRMVLIEQMRRQGWDLAAIDLGSLINDPTTHGGRSETNIRYTSALRSLDLLGYDALAFGAPDLSLGVAEVLGQYANTLGERLKVVAANVVPEPAFDLQAKFVPSVRAREGKVTLGITAVVDPEAIRQVKDDDKDSLLTVRPAEEALPPVLADLEKDTQVQVLMVQGPPDLARRLAETYRGFDVVVATSTAVDPPREPERLNEGKTLLVTVGRQGQYVGVIGFFDDPKQPVRYQRVWLTDRYDKDPAMVQLGEPMRKLLDDQFPGDLKLAGVLQSYPRNRFLNFNANAPSDATYVGAETCKECHAGSYDRWARSRHSLAYRGLTHENRNREWDADCVSCHTTGFEYVGGYTTPDATPYLKGNQCENCHGPGSQHAAEPDNPAHLASVARDVLDFDTNHRCMKCHDAENDPHFDFAKFWTRIDHNGLDNYDDPKVHRGIPPRVARQGAE